MIKLQGKNIKMDYGDYGIVVPIIITNVLETDEIKFNIYNIANELKIGKTLPFEDERWIFQLTKEESEALTAGDYWYEIVQYRNDILQNTIAKWFLFRVE